MKNLSFNIGIKEYYINGDENKILRVNTSDFNLIERFEKSEAVLRKIADKFETIADDATSETLSQLDKDVKNQIDYIFGNNASDVIFGNVSCISLAGGQPIFINFLDVILPVIEKDIVEEQKKSEQKIRKYTSKVK